MLHVLYAFSFTTRLQSSQTHVNSKTPTNASQSTGTGHWMGLLCNLDIAMNYQGNASRGLIPVFTLYFSLYKIYLNI